MVRRRVEFLRVPGYLWSSTVMATSRTLVKMFMVSSIGVLMSTVGAPQSSKAEKRRREPSPMKFSVSSPDVKNGGQLPLVSACEDLGGESKLPTLKWSKAPKGTKGFLVTIRDLSANKDSEGEEPSILFGFLSADAKIQGISKDALRGVVLLNDADEEEGGGATYLSPCPPPGEERRLQITVFTLGKRVIVKNITSVSEVLQRLRGSSKRKGVSAILAEASITATFTSPDEADIGDDGIDDSDEGGSSEE
jgi:phosphatidylethanolamine-binding protein (PEBP) family uncharacterized protein